MVAAVGMGKLPELVPMFSCGRGETPLSFEPREIGLQLFQSAIQLLHLGSFHC